MRYEDMINELAEEMLEKVANEIEEEEMEGYDYEDEEEVEGEVEGYDYEEEVMDESEELDEEEIEALAEELFAEELQKIAYGYEEELEKEAGVKNAAKELATKLAPKGFKNAKANKEMAEAALGGALNPHNPALKKYKKERNKLIAGGVAAGVGAAGAAGAGVAYGKKKVQEKAASYFEEAEFLKQAAEEAYQEAIMMQDAAVALYNKMEEE